MGDKKKRKEDLKMAELGKRLGIFLIGNLILWGVCGGLSNMMDGKTFFGRKKAPRNDTYVDWKGNVHLGPNDGWIC